jgi:hypothetical protein
MARQEAWEIFLIKPAEKNYDHVTHELQEQFDHCFAALEKTEKSPYDWLELIYPWELNSITWRPD